MNSLDLFLFLPVAAGFVFGLFKGLVKELTSLAAIVLGIFGAKLTAPFVSGLLVAATGMSKTLSMPVAYFISFVAIGVGLLMLSRALDKLMQSMALGGLNKFMGAVVGALKYALVISVMLNIFNVFDKKFSILGEEKKNESVCYGPLMKLGPALWDETKNLRSSQQ
ncbi:MAG TPA: CvpA family protein [Paludibacter sp.]|nr:CvpA family protein [Paludibacter sp.]